MIPESFIEELKYVANIEQTVSAYVALKRRGRNLLGLCPFHSEKTPSFTVYPETNSYYCFGCGNGGDVITFIKNIENIDYVDAIRFLAERNGLAVPEEEKDSSSMQRAKILEINRESARFFHEQLTADSGKQARAYLNARGLSWKTIRKFGVGYAPDTWDSLRDHLYGKGFSKDELIAAAVVNTGRNNSVYDSFRHRIIFPIIDLRGNIIGFGGRLMGEKGPKYLNSPDTLVFKKSRNLFSLNFAKATGSDTLILGEGYMDVIAMYQGGFKNAVATLGTSLTEEQARLISRYANKVVIAYDSDDAGKNAAKRAINLFSQTSVSVSVLEMEGAKDPDEYIKKFGAARFSNLIEGGKSAMDFEIDKIKDKYDTNTNEGKVEFLRDFCSLMADINNPLQRDVYIGDIASELDVSKESLTSTVEGIRKKKFRQNKQKNSRELAKSIPANIGTETKPRRHNIEGVVAEELLITMLLLHPDYYKSIKNDLTPEDFSDLGLREIFKVVTSRIDENLSLELIHLSGFLSNELMAKLSQLIVRGQRLKFYPEQIREYAAAIKAQHGKKTRDQLANMTPAEYNDYISSLKADKK